MRNYSWHNLSSFFISMAKAFLRGDFFISFWGTIQQRLRPEQSGIYGDIGHCHAQEMR